MQQTPMVRSHKIYSSILCQVNKVEHSNLSLSKLDDNLFIFLKNKGNKGLLEYISSLSVSDIDSKKILLLDAVRSALRYGENKDIAIQLIKGNI